MYNFHGTKLLVTDSNRNTWNWNNKFLWNLITKQLFILFSLGTVYFLETVWWCKVSSCRVHNCCLFISQQHVWFSSHCVPWFYSNIAGVKFLISYTLRLWCILTLILLTWRIWWSSNNTSRWQMGFNSVFKGLICCKIFAYFLSRHYSIVIVVCIFKEEEYLP